MALAQTLELKYLLSGHFLLFLRLWGSLCNPYGDSLIIVNWANRISALNSPFLYHWRKDIRSHILHFPSLTINHIYQEHNQQADSLSKNALDLDPGFGIFSEHLNGMISDHGNFLLF